MWTYDSDWHRVPLQEHVPYRTRLLVRRPADASEASGAVVVEPLHPRYEGSSVWAWTHPWILDRGHVWVGITQDAKSLESMKAHYDPARYADLHIAHYGMGWDIVGEVARKIRADAGLVLGGIGVDRMLLSGVSLTGSWCRVFLNGGFHERHGVAGGAPVFDGYLIMISSGGPARHGYPELSATTPPLPLTDPRRVVGAHGVPVIELQSEYEAETNGASIRADSDAPADPYRLFQVAGTTHVTGGPGAPPKLSSRQLADRGFTLAPRGIAESPSDGHMQYFARAAFELLDRWVSRDESPPHSEPLRPSDPDLDLPRGRTPGSRPLERDEYGNALGGVRAPWVAVPLCTYHPHSSPAEETAPTVPWGTHMTAFCAEEVADMIGHVTPVPAFRRAQLYTDRADYLRRYVEAVDRLIAQRFLLVEDRELLVGRADVIAGALLGGGVRS